MLLKQQQQQRQAASMRTRTVETTRKVKLKLTVKSEIQGAQGEEPRSWVKSVTANYEREKKEKEILK